MEDYSSIILGAGVYSEFTSSNVRSFRYDFDAAMLYVTFKDGSTYGYAGVDEDVVIAFINAPSKGKFVWQELRDRHPCRRL